MTNKKVLFTSHTANFQKFNRPFMRWFREQGWEVHYASMGEEKVFDVDKSFTVPFTRSPFGLSNISAYRQLKKIIEREQYDIIHTHTPMGSVVTRLSARRARKRGTRIIYTAHGFHFYNGAPLMNWLIYYPVERYMARHSDTLITINHEDYERAKAQFKTDVRYVPGVGIDPKKFDIPMMKAEKKELRAHLGLEESDFVLLYPAELNMNKNQKMLIDTMEQLVAKNSDIHLLLPGKDSMNGYHERIVNKKNLAGNIHFLGYRNDISQLLKVADVSVSSSRREGLPVNIMEAMYLGLPIISTDCRGNRDLVKNNSNGYVIAHNDNTAMTQHISHLLENKKTRNRFKRMSKSEITPYLIESVLHKMQNIYRNKNDANTLQDKRGLFVHDFKYLEYEGNAYGDGQFEYHNLWKKKYLSTFDSLTVVARGAATKNVTDIITKYRLDGDGVRFVATDSLSSLRRLFNTGHVNKILRKEIEQTDVAIVRLPSIQGLIACRLLNKMNKPYIIEVVGSCFDSLWYHDRIKGKLAAIPLHILTKYFIKKSENVLYVTNDYLQNKYPNKNNVLSCSDVIIDDHGDGILARRIDKVNRYNISTVYKLGLVGSYDVMYKGHDTAIKALARISRQYNVELHLLGSGDKERWIEYATKHGVGSRVFFDKPLNAGEQMLSWLDEIDILLVPSKTEGMPRVLLEGMSRASVVIGARAGDIPAILEKSDTIGKCSSSGLASRTVELLSDSNLMRTVAARNFKRAEFFLLEDLTAKRQDYIYRIMQKGHN